jgi:hypothetical protein
MTPETGPSALTVARRRDVDAPRAEQPNLRVELLGPM